MNNKQSTIEYNKQDVIHVSFGKGERYLYEWLLDHKQTTPFTMSGLIKRMIVNDYRRYRHSSKGSNLYPINLEATGFWIIEHTHHTHIEDNMNKEIRSTQSIKSILESMSKIPSFNLRFESAQEYVEYVFKRDLDFMKKNPTKRIWWINLESHSRNSKRN